MEARKEYKPCDTIYYQGANSSQTQVLHYTGSQTLTANIANELAKRGKNEVYLLVLENASHSGYMYDDKNDRDTYEAFIHAIYRKYGLEHESSLADLGEAAIRAASVNPRNEEERRGRASPTANTAR